MKTPWGKSQTRTTLCKGIHYVYTAGHGGYMVSKALAKTFLPSNALGCRAFVGTPYGNYYCFEEDCAWSVVEFYLMHANPEKLTKMGIPSYVIDSIRLRYKAIHRTLNCYYPEFLQLPLPF